MGCGRSLDDAVCALTAEAGQLAALAVGADGHAEDGNRLPAEVVDVRLTPGPPGSDRDAWVAYGTVRLTGQVPGAVGDSGHG
jgi:hypothetical protein